MIELADEYADNNLSRDFASGWKKLKLKYVTHNGYNIEPLPYKKSGLGKQITLSKSGWFDKKQLEKLMEVEDRFYDLESEYSGEYWDSSGKLSEEFMDGLEKGSAQLKAVKELSDYAEFYYEFCAQAHQMEWIEYAAVDALALSLDMKFYPKDTKFVEGVAQVED